MITFSCPACQKKHSVKEDLAGQKSKCPGCGQMVTIPAQVALAPSAEEMRTGPSTVGPEPPRQDQRTQSPQLDASSALTPSLSSDPDATEGFGNFHAGHDASLTDFLAPPQTDDELGRLGKYRILKILGHGGMGVVFLAEDSRLKRKVAIKAVLPTLAVSASAVQRFLREAQAMAAVKHDHIATIHQVDEERGIPFLAMEFLVGEPLAERLKRDEKLPLGEVLRIGREIAEALGAAHATGLIHRDIKPANVWLEAPRGRVKILDFGLARVASQDAGLTQQGVIIGTPAYMAPEQGRGEAVDHRCDLFSLGVVLYRLCTGQQPFKGENNVSMLMAVTLHQPPPPVQLNAEIPQELSDLIMRLLEKDADRRPASAGEVGEMLHTLERKLARQQEAREVTVALSASPVKAGPAAPGRRRRLPLVIAVLLVVAGLIGVGAFTLIRIQGEQGDYVIDTDDPDFSFRVSKGTVTLEDRKTSRKYGLKVVREDKTKGEHELEVTEADADLLFKTKTFTIKRGEQVALKAWFERKQDAGAKGRPGAGEDAWLKRVAAMPAARQVEEVAAKLKERNPGFEGKVTHMVEDGVVTELQFLSDKVTDLSPVRALSRLRTLKCNGTNTGGPLADLSPLKGMPLTTLHCYYSQVADLAPLKGMPLTELDLGATQVSDLSPLKDMRLTWLNINRTRLSDLSPLQGMPLTYLCCNSTLLADLSPLKGMPLKVLRCDFKPERDTEILRSIKTLEAINGTPAKGFWKEVDAQQAAFQAWLKQVAALPAEKQVEAVAARLKELNPGFDGKVTHKIEEGVVTELRFVTDHVTDISPVQGLTGLRLLDCSGSGYFKGRLVDLSPVKGMKLTFLDCGRNQVADLSPLKDMKLTTLACDNTQVADLSPLKGMPLTFLECGWTKVADLSPLRGIVLTTLWCGGTPVSDLSPLKDMRLADLRFGGTPVSDLSPLKDMKLTTLACNRTKVTDLTPLKDMKLMVLFCEETPVSDLSPLKAMPLKELKCDFKPERDAEALRSIKSLETINGKPAKEFWKEVDAKKP